MPQLTINLNLNIAWVYVLVVVLQLDYGRDDGFVRGLEGSEYIIRHLLVRVEFNYTDAQLCESDDEVCTWGQCRAP
jgi:hypothetical protein